MLTPAWQEAVLVALNPKFKRVPAAHMSAVEEVAVEGEEEARTNTGEEVATVMIPTAVPEVTVVTAVEDVAIVNVRAASPEPETAVLLVPTPSQATLTWVIIRSLPELFVIELVVAPVTGAIMTPLSGLFELKVDPVGEPVTTFCTIVRNGVRLKNANAPNAAATTTTPMMMFFILEDDIGYW